MLFHFFRVSTLKKSKALIQHFCISLMIIPFFRLTLKQTTPFVYEIKNTYP